MSSVGSASGRNRSGSRSPCSGCCQRTRASTASNWPFGEARLGLVVQHQLVGLDRTPKLGDEHRGWPGRSGPGPGRSATAPRVLLLGDVQRDVGPAQQLVDVVPVGIGEHVADARLDGHRDRARRRAPDRSRRGGERGTRRCRSGRRSGSRTRRRRDARSCPRTFSSSSSRCASSISTASPLWWPSESLMSLNRSRSTIAIANGASTLFHADERVGDSSLEQPAVRAAR